MNGSRAVAALIVLFSGCACLVACDDSAPDTESKAATPTQAAGPKLAKPAENMVAAVPAGKSAKFVGVHFSLGNVPTVNQALPVEISIIPHETFASLGASFEAQDGLTLISGDVLQLTKNAASEQPIKHQLAVMPAREGVFVITATVQTEGDEGSVSRVFSIPVIVAPPAAAGAPTAPAEASGSPGAN
ncbi:MAG TPA: hypothetical protein VFO82_07340 [Steroidobacteraceae bacterium]|nr:hypothetical protein [Steroidobacteraceae bacterium]